MGHRERTGPSLAWRLAAAIALTVGFYALALFVAAALLAAAIVPWVVGEARNVWVTLTCLVVGVTILAAIVPRRRRLEPHGVRVTEAGQPRLHAMIAEEARATGTRAPDEVYATLEANAAVADAGGRRVMIVGVPLLHILSERGLRGIIAHEFGHYAGGDTRLGPWIWRTYDGVARTIERLTQDDGGWTRKAVRLPFLWYGRAFMRISAAIKRRQELAADRMAADRAGRDTYAAALRRIHAYGPSFDAYWEQEVAAVLGAGRRPPVVAGFATYLRSDTIDRAASSFLEQLLREETGRYDSHPSLSERLDALEACAPGAPDDSTPALALLRDPEALERELLATLVHPAAAELPQLGWDDVGREVYLARARALSTEHAAALGAARVGELGYLAQDLARIAGAVRRYEPGLSADAAPDFAATLLAEALLVALADDGWTVEAALGEPVAACRESERLEPFGLVASLREERTTATGWHDRAAALGIAELPLRPPAPASPDTTAAEVPA